MFSIQNYSGLPGMQVASAAYGVPNQSAAAAVSAATAGQLAAPSQQAALPGLVGFHCDPLLRQESVEQQKSRGSEFAEDFGQNLAPVELS